MFIFTGITNSIAQNQTTATNKYEIAVDLQNFFSDGTPDKVLFKLNNIKNNQIKGAYRFGIGTSYWVDLYKITHDDENYELTAKQHKTDLSLSLGYEFQREYNRAIFYYGADLGTSLSRHDDIDFPNVNEYYKLFFVPFVGVKVLLNDNLAVAFEAGAENFVQWSKTEGSENFPDNRQYHLFYQSHFDLPYSLTFNFNF
ncbi:hypothetical protein [Draconibacterium halophilum]|uniref:Outer membrane protein beta-barrel domain-containing protein n=1 Tax=Draconibacterium halophilum TaxID=2706887 RepID=A0A6C0RCD0_9BACT|nr:hypothetical protein [Draconibacterium halophilum]QIA07143.1 hypothetical protein G0Q07_05100 [Draconibacterium halophilum]